MEASVDFDEALLVAWEVGLSHVMGPGHLLKGAEANLVRRALGVATTREVASLAFWSRRLQVPESDLAEQLAQDGVGHPTVVGKLSKRQISRLRQYGATNTVAAEVKTVVSETPYGTGSTPPLTWRTVGRGRPTRYLTVDDVAAIHDELSRDFESTSDPIEPAGIRDYGLLESAVSRPWTSIGEDLKYPTIEMAGAALLVGVVHNHSFHNGNKRTALVAAMAFLDANGMLLECGDDEIFRVLVQLAGHTVTVDGEASVVPGMDSQADRETLAIALWLKRNSRWIERGDRPLSWRRLRPILFSFGCEAELVGNGPRRFTIRRTVVQNGKFLGRTREKRILLQTAIQVVDDGRDLTIQTIRKVRSDLELDEERGTDSLAFYGRAEPPSAEFIRKYRKLLGRLARV